ncbi:MarR family winged helix-turn-helix transcriptional regulator [Streptomyces sp. CA-100214]
MNEDQHGAAITNVVRQLTAIAVIRRQLVRELPHRSGNAAIVLVALAHGGETRLSQLAEHLDCDLSGISRQVAQLELRGAVSRRTNPDDRRSSLIDITAQGHAEVNELLAIHTGLIAQATADWTPDEITVLTGLLDRLRDGLARRIHGAETPVGGFDSAASARPEMPAAT